MPGLHSNVVGGVVIRAADLNTRARLMLESGVPVEQIRAYVQRELDNTVEQLRMYFIF